MLIRATTTLNTLKKLSRQTSLSDEEFRRVATRMLELTQEIVLTDEYGYALEDGDDFAFPIWYTP